MPAAAVIPAPIAYIKVVAVKKLVVGSRMQACGPPRGGHCSSLQPSFGVSLGALDRVSRVAGTFTLMKLECLKRGRFARIMVHGMME